MSPRGDVDRWYPLRLQLMQRWPALMRALPERIEVVTQGGAIGLSDASVVVRADWLTEASRSQLIRAALHLAAHAALGHRPWRQHPSVPDEVLDRAAHGLLMGMGVDGEDAAWCADHHGNWPGVPIRAPGETWVTAPQSASSNRTDSAAPFLSSRTDNPSKRDSGTSESSPVMGAETRMPGGAGDLHVDRVRGATASRPGARNRATDWRAVLRLWLLQRSYQRWQFDRPARRRVDPFILPRLAGRQLRLAVALDISGSIDPQWFEQFFREIETLRGLLPLQLRLLTCDNRIHLDQPLQGVATQPTFSGGGGTDFQPVFARLAGDAGLDALIYCTDLLGDYPAHPPHFPVFWLVPAVVRAVPVRPSDPPFGCVLTMHGGPEA